MQFSKSDLEKQVSYKTSRSGGKGGQNVNKVSSKVELLFSVDDAEFFIDDEKAVIKKKLQSRLNKDGLIQVICDEQRSQYLNKEIALERLMVLLSGALQKVKPRKPTKISKQAKAARLTAKKINAQKKENRKRDFGI